MQRPLWFCRDKIVPVSVSLTCDSGVLSSQNSCSNHLKTPSLLFHSSDHGLSQNLFVRSWVGIFFAFCEISLNVRGQMIWDSDQRLRRKHRREQNTQVNQMWRSHSTIGTRLGFLILDLKPVPKKQWWLFPLSSHRSLPPPPVLLLLLDRSDVIFSGLVSVGKRLLQDQVESQTVYQRARRQGMGPLTSCLSGHPVEEEP